MVEVLVLVKPLNGQGSLVGVEKSLIFRVDVFLSALYGDEDGCLRYCEVVA